MEFSEGRIVLARFIDTVLMLKLLQHHVTMNVYIGKLLEGSRRRFLVLDADFLKYLTGFYISETVFSI